MEIVSFETTTGFPFAWLIFQISLPFFVALKSFSYLSARAKQDVYKRQVLTYALFPQVATDFFKYREAQQTKVDQNIADTKNGAYPV